MTSSRAPNLVNRADKLLCVPCVNRCIFVTSSNSKHANVDADGCNNDRNSKNGDGDIEQRNQIETLES